MKFGTGKLYIESYNKCSNCGMLVYEAAMPGAIHKGKELFCSAWCEEWDVQRGLRRGAPAAEAQAAE